MCPSQKLKVQEAGSRKRDGTGEGGSGMNKAAFAAATGSPKNLSSFQYQTPSSSSCSTRVEGRPQLSWAQLGSAGLAALGSMCLLPLGPDRRDSHSRGHCGLRAEAATKGRQRLMVPGYGIPHICSDFSGQGKSHDQTQSQGWWGSTHSLRDTWQWWKK